MFGSNITAEDVMVATSFPGIAFGMAWKHYSTGALDQQSVGNSMLHGINVKPAALVMPDDTGCSEAYRVTVTSFDADGFTCSMSNVTVPGALVHYLAWGEMDGAGGVVANSGTFAVDYRALTGIGFNYRTSGGIRDGCEDGIYNTMYVGGANWPDDENPPTHSNRTWGTAGFSRLITIGTMGFVVARANINPSPQFDSAINFTTGDFPPIVNENYGRMWRNASEDIQIAMGGGPLKYYGQWWTGEGYHNSCSADAVLGGENLFVAGGAVEEIEAAWFAGVLGSNESGLGTSSRMMLGVITDEHQAVVGASREGGGWAYQSRNKCMIDNFDETTGGLLAASGVIEDEIIRFTTEEASAPANGNVVCFSYGPDVDQPDMWMMEV